MAGNLRWVDRTGVIVLALAGAGHGFPGTLLTLPLTETQTLWSFSGTIAVWAVAALNWLRIGRPYDKELMAWSLAGSIAWVGIMIWLMAIADMWRDVRPWLFISSCCVLAIFAVGGLLRGRRSS